LRAVTTTSPTEDARFEAEADGAATVTTLEAVAAGTLVASAAHAVEARAVSEAETSQKAVREAGRRPRRALGAMMIVQVSATENPLEFGVSGNTN
jgi:hypothetical protein